MNMLRLVLHGGCRASLPRSTYLLHPQVSGDLSDTGLADPGFSKNLTVTVTAEDSRISEITTGNMHVQSGIPRSTKRSVCS